MPTEAAVGVCAEVDYVKIGEVVLEEFKVVAKEWVPELIITTVVLGLILLVLLITAIVYLISLCVNARKKGKGVGRKDNYTPNMEMMYNMRDKFVNRQEGYKPLRIMED